MHKKELGRLCGITELGAQQWAINDRQGRARTLTLLKRTPKATELFRSASSSSATLFSLVARLMAHSTCRLGTADQHQLLPRLLLLHAGPIHLVSGATFRCLQPCCMCCCCCWWPARKATMLLMDARKESGCAEQEGVRTLLDIRHRESICRTFICDCSAC